MSRYRQLIVTLGVVALLLFSFSAAAAKNNDKPKLPHGASHPRSRTGKPALLTWTPGRITQAVSAGQTFQITASFTSSVDIAEAMLVIPGGLGKLMQADSATLTTIKAGTPTMVKFTITMPADGAHPQGGVVQIRARQRMLAQPLPVLLTVANRNVTGQDEDDAAKPAKPAKPLKPAKAKPIHP